MSEDNESLKSLINASGFLFQLRVQREIELNPHSTWSVSSTEHRWEDPSSGQESFIDIVLQKRSGIARIIIECKRVQDGQWIFLVADEQLQTSYAKILWTHESWEKGAIGRWDDVCFGDFSYQSSFCVVRGQGENDRPMLERLSGQLLRSTEILANDELENCPNPTLGPARIYIPVIVTNAQLRICKYKSDNISIDTGKLEEANFETASFIKFRKNLSSVIQDKKRSDSISSINEAQQRTVFIVNAQKLNEFLKGDLRPYDGNANFPWQTL
ncbi:MAG: hypothetical protein JW786_00005 [Desulfobacterales bacterium]|nr:hypothetical protein [Desulfobacterales bacterium]